VKTLGEPNQHFAEHKSTTLINRW